MVQKHRNEWERGQEISLRRAALQNVLRTMDRQNTSIERLFEPDQYGEEGRTVLLQGQALRKSCWIGRPDDFFQNVFECLSLNVLAGKSHSS